MTDLPVLDHMAKALQFAPIIEKVHGAHHPELTRVREITERIAAANDATVKTELFRELRDVTNGYAIPEDACGTFSMTYEALAAAEREHLASQA